MLAHTVCSIIFGIRFAKDPDYRSPVQCARPGLRVDSRTVLVPRLTKKALSQKRQFEFESKRVRKRWVQLEK